jgi:hypothetical protein
MLYSGKQIVSRIKSHIRKRGGKYPAWIVGVSKDAREQLFEAHGVRRKGDKWILLHAESSLIARKVRHYLVNKLGIAGAEGLAGKTADFVYAYRKSPNTRP